MTKLFSYGTLQIEKVQIESFGRILSGIAVKLPGYKLAQLKITDPDVLEKSQQEFHPIAIPSENHEDYIAGVLFEITKQELAQADSYEVDDYKRIKANFLDQDENIISGWVYIKA